MKVLAGLTLIILMSIIVLCSISLTQGQSDLGNLTFMAVRDQDGSIWVASVKGALHIMEDGGVEVFNKEKGLNDDTVQQVLIGPDGTKWFIHSGVFNIGMSEIQNAMGVSHPRQDGTIEVFAADKGISSGMVYCIAFDQDGTTWFGTNSGLAHLNQDGTIEILTEKEGLPDSSVRHIIVSKERKWFATNNGMAYMDATGKIHQVWPKALAETAKSKSIAERIELKEAFKAGLVQVTFTGREKGEKLEITVKRISPKPLTIVIKKGTTTLEEITFFTDRELKLDLSVKVEDSVIAQQTGKVRLKSGSVTMKMEPKVQSPQQ